MFTVKFIMSRYETDMAHAWIKEEPTLTNMEVRNIIRAIDRGWMSERESTAIKALTGQKFTSAQLAQVLDAVSFDDAKLRVMYATASGLVDCDIELLQESMSFLSSRSKVADILL